LRRKGFITIPAVVIRAGRPVRTGTTGPTIIAAAGINKIAKCILRYAQIAVKRPKSLSNPAEKDRYIAEIASGVFPATKLEDKGYLLVQ